MGCSVWSLQRKCQLLVANRMCYRNVSSEKYFKHNLAMYVRIPVASHSFQALVNERCQGEMDENRRSVSTETLSDPRHMKAEVGFDPVVLGQQFCQWFFQLLNSQNPSLGQQPQDWGPQHFWPDVKLRLLSR